MDRRRGVRPGPRSRRAVCVGALVALVGCVGGDGPTATATATADDRNGAGNADADATGTPTSTGTASGTATGTSNGVEDATDAGTGTASGAAGTDGLDLREANVTDVSVRSVGGDDYRFDVTLYHDDDGEEGYANWWDVETRAGERLGRRDLLHAHGTREFTRSATVTVPSGVDCVVVRGHDQVHGFGGRAALVTHRTGATRFVDGGTEPAAVADLDCP